MCQVRFWAIAPIALVATFSGKPTLSLSVSNSGGVANSSSTLISAEFPQNLTDANPAGLGCFSSSKPQAVAITTEFANSDPNCRTWAES
jgi:hypothetical protein